MTKLSVLWAVALLLLVQLIAAHLPHGSEKSRPHCAVLVSATPHLTLASVPAKQHGAVMQPTRGQRLRLAVPDATAALHVLRQHAPRTRAAKRRKHQCPV